MGRVIFLGIPNLNREAYVTASTTGAAGLEPAELEASWIKTEEPSEISRLNTLDPAHTQWRFDTANVPVAIDGFALINHNITDGGQVRFVASLTSGVNLIAPDKLAPSSIVSSSNATGLVTSIDEDIYSPDGLTIGPTTTNNSWRVELGFNTPTNPPLVGEDMLCFVVRVQRIAGSSLTYYPTMSATLLENSSLIRSMGRRAVTSTVSGGQIFIFPFSMSELSDPTGAGIGVDLDFVPGSGTGGQYAVLHTVALYYEDTVYGPDSGWITINGDQRRGPLEPTKSIHFLPNDPANEGWENLLTYTVLVRTDQADHDPVLGMSPLGVFTTPAGAITSDPDSFIQAGVAVAGERISLTEGPNVEVRAATRIEVNEIEGTDITGHTYGMDAWARRVTDPIDVLVSREELEIIRNQLAWRRRRNGAFYLALESDDDIATQRFTSFWATITEIGAPRWYGRIGSTDYYVISVSFEERL